MIQHISKIKIFVIAIFSIFFINCKDNDNKKEKTENITIKTNDSNKPKSENLISKSTFQGENFAFYMTYFQSGGETDLPEISEEAVVEKFKKLKIVISGDTISIDGSKSFYEIDKMDSKKFFGRKYVYDYNIDVYKNIFGINNIDKNINFINLDTENSDVSPFKDYFLETGVAVYENELIFLNYKRYFVCFKKVEEIKSNNLKYSELPFDFERLDRLCKRDSRNKYQQLCDNEYPIFDFNDNPKLKNTIQEKIKDKNLLNYYNIRSPFKNISIIIVICEHEEESYGDQYIISVKDGSLVNLLEDNKDDFFHSKNFIINKDLTINIYENNGLRPKEKITSIFKLNQDGSFSNIK